jgi:maltose alpha-D-glucosyltransferase/alpha-amylase
MIIDFEGEPARTYSERRLKRSPFRDVAGMLRSFHYAAYNGLFTNIMIDKTDRTILEPWSEVWYYYMSQFYMKAYIDNLKDAGRFIPEEKEDLKILLQTFLLEKAIYELNYELNNRPEWVLIPIRGIKSLVKHALKE